MRWGGVFGERGAVWRGGVAVEFEGGSRGGPEGSSGDLGSSAPAPPPKWRRPQRFPRRSPIGSLLKARRWASPFSDWLPPPEVGGARLAREDWSGGNGGGGGGSRAGVRALKAGTRRSFRARRHLGAHCGCSDLLMAGPVSPREGAGRPHTAVSRLVERLRAAVALPEEEGEIPARVLAEHLMVREPKSAALAPKRRRSSQHPQRLSPNPQFLY